jgi:hypothetical protein
MRIKLGLILMFLSFIFINVIFKQNRTINKKELLTQKNAGSYSNQNTKLAEENNSSIKKNIFSSHHNLVDFNKKKDLILFLHIPKTSMLLKIVEIEEKFWNFFNRWQRIRNKISKKTEDT